MKKLCFLKSPRLSFILLFLSLTVTSCYFGFIPFAGRGNLIIRLASSQNEKTLVPDTSLDVVKYDIYGSGPESQTFNYFNITDSSFKVMNLLPGTWTVTAIGKNATDAEIVKTTKEVTVVVNENSTLDLLCIPLVGNGSLNLSLSWPLGTIITPMIQASLVPDTGDEIPLSFTIDGSSATCVKTLIPNGYYTLTIKLKDEAKNNAVIWPWVESVLIYKDVETNNQWELEKSNLTIPKTGEVTLSLASDPKAPIEISLSGNLASLFLNETMTITAEGTPTPTSWRWFLDGDVIPAETSSVITIGDGLAAETVHTLTVIAKRGDIFGSSGFQFRVTNSIPTEGLLAEYLGDSNATDTSGNGNNGTVVGVTLTTGHNNEANSAFYFPGNIKYIDIPVSIEGNYSVSLWLKTNYGYRQHLLSGTTNRYSTNIYMPTVGKIGFCTNRDDFYDEQSIDTSYFRHLVISYDDASRLKKIYIDGVLVLQKTAVGELVSDTNYRLGGNIDGDYFSGTLDDIRIYNRVLSQSEVTSLFNY